MPIAGGLKLSLGNDDLGEGWRLELDVSDS